MTSMIIHLKIDIVLILIKLGHLIWTTFFNWPTFCLTVTKGRRSSYSVGKDVFFCVQLYATLKVLKVMFMFRLIVMVFMHFITRIYRCFIENRAFMVSTYYFSSFNHWWKFVFMLGDQWPQMYIANHAAFPIQIRKITAQICG